MSEKFFINLNDDVVESLQRLDTIFYANINELNEKQKNNMYETIINRSIINFDKMLNRAANKAKGIFLENELLLIKSLLTSFQLEEISMIKKLLIYEIEDAIMDYWDKIIGYEVNKNQLIDKINKLTEFETYALLKDIKHSFNE